MTELVKDLLEVADALPSGPDSMWWRQVIREAVNEIERLHELHYKRTKDSEALIKSRDLHEACHKELSLKNIDLQARVEDAKQREDHALRGLVKFRDERDVLKTRVAKLEAALRVVAEEGMYGLATLASKALADHEPCGCGTGMGCTVHNITAPDDEDQYE